ncbi:hypothetical protein D3C80_1371720 [compost metagenome]
MRAGLDPRAVLALQLDLLAAVLVVEHQAVEKGIEINPARRLAVAIDAAGIGHAFAHQVLHGLQGAPELVPVDAVVHGFDPQLHPRDRRLQVMGDRRQQLHALFQVGADACLQAVEGHCGIHHFPRAAFVQLRPRGVGVELVDRFGQAGQRADRDFHRQPGAQQQKCQLDQQHHG